MASRRKRKAAVITGTVHGLRVVDHGHKSYKQVRDSNEASATRFEDMVNSMSRASRELVRNLADEHGTPSSSQWHSFDADDNDNTANDEDQSTAWETDDDLGSDLEDEVADVLVAEDENARLVREAFDGMASKAEKRDWMRPGYTRTWAGRAAAEDAHWAAQMDELTSTYLNSKAGGSGLHLPTPDPSPQVFSIVGMDLFDTSIREIEQRVGESPNAALLRAGFLGSHPINPFVAFSVKLLELYHRLRRRHPRLGVEPFIRAVCDVQSLRYRRYLRQRLSNTFDAYLCVLRAVQAQVNEALGRGKDWRVRNSCPACCNELPGEPTLVPSRLWAIDGNNSGRRYKSSGVEDARVFESDYFLDRGTVDDYRNEVGARAAAERGPQVDAGAALEDGETVARCTENWKAAGKDSQKIASDAYDVTGIFGGNCRHGLVLMFAEMVQSGELAKYPLAVVDHVLKTTEQNDLGLASDIGCSFKKTVLSSPKVGPRARAQRLQVFLNAFHGWAHRWVCQLLFHPLYRLGLGLEDLEAMERLFSASNNVARVVRFATQYHFLQAYDLFFQQWDQDKYANISTFLLNNFKQAVAIIKTYSLEVEGMLRRQGLSEDDVVGWIEQEAAWLDLRRQEPPQRTLQCNYVEALRAFDAAERALEHANATFARGHDGRDLGYNDDVRRSNALERSRRRMFDRRAVAEQSLAAFEERLQITVRWTPTDPCYMEAAEYLNHRELHKVLGELQALLIQRLFEMSKANVAGLGYKLRTSIWKHLKTRSKAIQTALQRYDRLRLRLNPRPPKLGWKDMVNAAIVSDFDVLRERYAVPMEELPDEPWMHPGNREVANRLHKILRAREELTRVYVEAARLRNWLFVEDEAYRHAIQQVEAAGRRPLAIELRAQYWRRRAVNESHHAVLNKLEGHPDYGGLRGAGAPGAWPPTHSTPMETNSEDDDVLAGLAGPALAGEQEGIDEQDEDALGRLSSTLEGAA